MPSDQENIEQLMRDVRRQGEQIDALYRHFGLGRLDAAASGSYPDVIDAIRQGNTILAIKAYRDHTGVGLREAKDAVDALARGL